METSREVLFLNQFDATCWNEIINEYSIRMHYKSKSLVRRLVGTREACCACYDPFTPSAVLICVSSRYTARRFRNGEHELYKQCGSEICFQPSAPNCVKKIGDVATERIWSCEGRGRWPANRRRAVTYNGMMAFDTGVFQTFFLSSRKQSKCTNINAGVGRKQDKRALLRVALIKAFTVFVMVNSARAPAKTTQLTRTLVYHIWYSKTLLKPWRLSITNSLKKSKKKS